ncbi:SIMPL domain-containing protein [Microbacterium soli]|uniref:SIMPL domain-containing protein n=1 Tax=Microbacterium soli TaxID=446075 RepID=A0ABP7MKY7_9MICO
MSDVIITVRGEHELRVAPERATVHLAVSGDGAVQDEVVAAVLAAAAPVREGLEERQRAGTVDEWTSRRLGVHSERPWSSEGRQLAPVHRATVEFTATFSDIPEMSLWVSGVSAEDSVSIGEVRWHLTPQTEAALEREAATLAVGAAVTRARAYAEALGLDDVTPLEITDRGLISTGAPAQPKAVMMRAAMDSGPVMRFQADEITVSATVEGRFRAH